MTSAVTLKGDLAVLVSSCDAYSDAWMPFFTLFFKYWPDCPYAVYLLTESKIYNDIRVKTLHVNHLSWATRLRTAIRQIPESYVLYLQEDYFLKEPVHTGEIARLFSITQREHAACLRLYPDPSPTLSFKTHKEVGEVARGTAYRLSTQATIWNKRIFHDLLQDGDNPWNTEHDGSQRSNAILEPFLCVFRDSIWSWRVSPVFEYVCTGISKRMWTHEALNLFAVEHIAVDISQRPTEKYTTYIRRRLRRIPYFGWVFFHVYRVEFKLRTLMGAV